VIVLSKGAREIIRDTAHKLARRKIPTAANLELYPDDFTGAKEEVIKILRQGIEWASKRKQTVREISMELIDHSPHPDAVFFVVCEYGTEEGIVKSLSGYPTYVISPLGLGRAMLKRGA
jgi:hypothetical protein